MRGVAVGLLGSVVLACGSPTRGEIDTLATSLTAAGEDGDGGGSTFGGVDSGADADDDAGTGGSSGGASSWSGGDQGTDGGDDTTTGAQTCAGHPCPTLLDPVGANDVLVVDMTGDGNRDVVVATNTGIRVLPSKGNGGFFQPISVTTPSAVTGLRLVSSHGVGLGGDLQIAAICPGADAVYIYRNGPGFAALPPTIVAGAEPLDAIGVASTGDVDSDLLIAEAGSGNLSWWRRTPSGGFQAEPVRFTMGGSPARLSARQIDKGDLQIAVLDRGGGVRVIDIDETLSVVGNVEIGVDKENSDVLLGAFSGQENGLLVVSPNSGRVVQYARSGTLWSETSAILISGAPVRLASVWYPEASNPVALALPLRDADAVAIVPWSDNNDLLQPPSTTYETVIDPVALDGRSDLDGNGLSELVVASPSEGTWITWDAW